jgi:hypothetical protein
MNAVVDAGGDPHGSLWGHREPHARGVYYKHAFAGMGKLVPGVFVPIGESLIGERVDVPINRPRQGVQGFMR